MIRIILSSVLSLTFCSCDLGDPAGAFRVDFGLLDNSGKETTIFNYGDTFEIRFLLTNGSGEDQRYYYSDPPVIFEIRQADTTVATSIDGMMFPAVVLRGTLKEGETYRINWIAPNSPARDRRLILPVGQYQAVVRHRAFFEAIRVPPTQAISFTVVP